MKTRSNWVAIELVRTLTIYMLIDIDIDIFEAITFIVVPYIMLQRKRPRYRHSLTYH